MNKLIQENPEKYKQTELGTIPLDWQCSHIRDIANIKVGSDVKLEHFSSEADSNYKYPVFSNTVDYPGIYGFYNFAEYAQQAVTVVGRGVGLGTAFVREKGFGAIGRLIVATPFVANAKFLAAYINEYVEVHNESSGVPQLTGVALGDKLVPLPPKEEQTAIANALSDVEALLTELEELIAKKQAIKTAAMQQLLTGKTRLPQFATYTEGEKQGQPKGTKPSELGEIPEDWDVGKFSDVCLSFKTGKLDANAMRNDGEYRFYTCARKHYYIDHYAFDTEALLVSGNGANVGYVHYFKGKFNAYQRTYVLSDFCADVKYLKIYLEERLAERIRVEVNSGNTPYITMDTLTDMLVILPPSEEQAAIANILSDMDNEIQILEQRLAKTRQIKQGMMQELLTGRTRLPFDKD